MQDNFRKVVEVRKKLIGDTGDTLITPYRVWVCVCVHWYTDENTVTNLHMTFVLENCLSSYPRPTTSNLWSFAVCKYGGGRPKRFGHVRRQRIDTQEVAPNCKVIIYVLCWSVLPCEHSSLKPLDRHYMKKMVCLLCLPDVTHMTKSPNHQGPCNRIITWKAALFLCLFHLPSLITCSI